MNAQPSRHDLRMAVQTLFVSVFPDAKPLRVLSAGVDGGGGIGGYGLLVWASETYDLVEGASCPRAELLSEG